MIKNKTIFGCESLIPNFLMQVDKAYDNFIFDKIDNTIRCSMPEMQIDVEKLKNGLKCAYN